ncbi:hypothetical protein JW977_03850 [Candidatus Falkowbacteria bacterium]|nr:hypothetical protein [Candidatus Falkowbacteria bacterium]
MVERPPKYERRKTINDLANEVSKELRYTNGNFSKACKNVLDREGVTNDFEERLKFKSAIGRILGEHSASLKTKKPKIKTQKTLEPVDILKQANIRRIEKMQEKTPLFGEEIAEKEGLANLKKDK